MISLFLPDVLQNCLNLPRLIRHEVTIGTFRPFLSLIHILLQGPSSRDPGGPRGIISSHINQGPKYQLLDFHYVPNDRMPRLLLGLSQQVLKMVPERGQLPPVVDGHTGNPACRGNVSHGRTQSQ